MELRLVLEKVENNGLRKLAQPWSPSPSTPRAELLALLADELPLCPVEGADEPLGLDGAFLVVVDYLSDIRVLDLLLETSWLQHEAGRGTVTYRVTQKVMELPLRDARLLLGILLMATAEDLQRPMQAELEAAAFQGIVEIERASTPKGSVPAQARSGQSEPPRSSRASIPPGFSTTLESIRSLCQVEASSEAKGSFEAFLGASRPGSLTTAALQLDARNRDTHAVCLGKTACGVIDRSTVSVAKQLFLDYSAPLTNATSETERAKLKKTLSQALTLHGVPVKDADSVADVALELQEAPQFWSSEHPPPLPIVARELGSLLPDQLPTVLDLLYDVFYRDSFGSCRELHRALRRSSKP